MKACLVIILVLLSLGAGSFLYSTRTIALAELKNVQKDGFWLRVSTYPEGSEPVKIPFPYRIESSKDGVTWREAKTWHQQDISPESDIDIQVLDSRIAHFFNMAQFGVTTDGGSSWAFFDLGVWETGSVMQLCNSLQLCTGNERDLQYCMTDPNPPQSSMGGQSLDLQTLPAH